MAGYSLIPRSPCWFGNETIDQHAAATCAGVVLDNALHSNPVSTCMLRCVSKAGTLYKTGKFSSNDWTLLVHAHVIGSQIPRMIHLAIR